jgi:uncharacterized protein YndB with AHSA1/START domain
LNSEPRATVRVRRSFQAAPELVFDAWLSPQTACKFLFATPTGKMVRTEIDGRVGGAFLLIDRRDGVDVEHVGEYLEIDRPRRLVFVFRVPHYSAESSRVTLDFAPLEPGCELVLLHEGVLPEYEVSTQAGWKMILEALDGALKSRETEI